MRVATWNVNSARTRIDNITEFLSQRDIDVLAMQETKCRDNQFPTEAFTDLGYEVAHVGYNQWNGVAIASRVGLDDVSVGFSQQPGFDKDQDADQAVEARAIGARCGGVYVWSLYVPNGRTVDDRHYDYKLRWLYALRDHIVDQLNDNPQDRLLLLGDFNIAPTDRDVWDRDFFRGKTHVTPPERAALAWLLRGADLSDIGGRLTRDAWTYWDYQGYRFDRNQGMRIDFQLSSAALTPLASEGFVDVDARSKPKASDHAPLVVDYHIATNTDDGSRS